MVRPIVPQCYPSGRADRHHQPAEPARRALSRRGAARRRRTCCCSTACIWSPTRSRAGVHDRAGRGHRRRRATIADVRPLVDRLTRAGVEVVTVSAPVMDAHQPGAIAERDRRARPSGRRAPATRVYGGDAARRRRGRRAGSRQPRRDRSRVAEAGGATGVVAAGASADPFGWKALRGSMGSALRLPIVVRASTPTTAIADARRHGCRDRRHRAARRPVAVRRRSHAARSPILIGGEGQGLPPALRRRRRRARHDPDAGAGRIAERRGHRGADRLRSARQRSEATLNCALSEVARSS